MNTICGVDCSQCGFKDTCSGCAPTGGRPFGRECIIAACRLSKGEEPCGQCSGNPCGLKEKLIAEFNALGIEDMEKVKNLHGLKGSIVNMEYTFPGGQTAKFWEDDKIYLGNLIRKKNSDKFLGLAADENYLLVCEVGADGSDAEIVVYKKRKG